MRDGRNEGMPQRVDGTSVYWIANSTTAAEQTSVLKVGIAGGSPVTLATLSGTGTGLAIDATSVYLAAGVSEDSTTGEIVKITPK